MRLKFNEIHEKAYSQSLHLQENFIKQIFGVFCLNDLLQGILLILQGDTVKRALVACCTRSRSVPSEQE